MSDFPEGPWSPPGPPPPPGAPPPGWSGPPQPYYQQPWMGAKAPHAMTALALGIVALASLVVLCGVALPAAPFAWYFGSRALREIDDSGGTLGGRDEARAGQIMGIIGTALLGFGLMVILAVIVAASV